MTKEAAKMNVYQRINAVMRDCEYIQKKQSQQGKGVPYDEVIAMLRKHIIKHGLVIVVRQESMDLIGPVDGTKQKVFQGKYEMDIVNIDNPEDKVTHVAYAHGMDGGDKAPGKCQTYAVKIMMVKGFCIETGIDEESREEKIEKAKPKPLSKDMTRLWEGAKAAYVRDGNLDKVKASIEVTPEIAAQIIAEAGKTDEVS